MIEEYERYKRLADDGLIKQEEIFDYLAGIKHYGVVIKDPDSFPYFSNLVK